MKDIKVKTNKIAEKPVSKKVETVAEATVSVFQSTTKKTYSKFSTILFGFMTTSVICYVFMISSSVFYAVKMSQLTFKSENITSSVSTSSESYETLTRGNSDRISYINKDSDTSISLK